MTNKERYTAWCAEQPDLPVFMQPWWMDAVCAGKGWDVLLYVHPRTEQILAALPYLTGKRLWMHFVLMPQQTQIGGIWLDYSLRNDDGSVWDKETLQTICDYMAEQLAQMGLHYYYQHYPVGSPCPEFMKARGMRIRERVTYRVEDLSDMDAVVKRFSRNKQRQLRKAQGLVVHRGELNAEQFYYFHCRCLETRHKTISYSREFLMVLERKTRRNGCSEIISLTDRDGNLYAAAYVVWDKQMMHYLIAACAPEQKDSGAMARLVLECMRLAREVGVAFDFEGSMIPGVAKSFRQFGASAATYFSVERFYRWWFRLPYWAYRLWTYNRR